MTDRDRASASIQRRRRTPQPRSRTPLPKQPESQELATEQGFLFDPYWDEVFAAYYDPTLHVCCQLRY